MTKFEQYIKENHPDPDWLMENKEVYDEMVRLGDNFKDNIKPLTKSELQNLKDKAKINCEKVEIKPKK